MASPCLEDAARAASEASRPESVTEPRTTSLRPSTCFEVLSYDDGDLGDPAGFRVDINASHAQDSLNLGGLGKVRLVGGDDLGQIQVRPGLLSGHHPVPQLGQAGGDYDHITL